MTQEIFKEYGQDPIVLCQNWMKDAEKSEINDPAAICLATASSDGRPSNRMVLIKEVSQTGFKFHTNAESRKGEEIADNPHGALCFHWKSLRKQIRIEGKIEEVSTAESDEYFKTRPVGRQVGAWASQQSRPFESKADLQAAIDHYTEKFKDENNIPRPDYWKGFRLKPTSIEFWIGNRNRVHERFIYTKQDDGSWAANWLYP